MFEILGGIISGLLLAFVVRARVRAWRAQIAARDHHLAIFFSLATTLRDDPRLPEHELDVIGHLNDALSDPNAPDVIGEALAEMDTERADGRPSHRTVPQELQAQWSRLILSWFMAVTYLHPQKGRLLRDRVLYMVDNDQHNRAVTIVDRGLNPSSRKNRLVAA